MPLAGIGSVCSGAPGGEEAGMPASLRGFACGAAAVSSSLVIGAADEDKEEEAAPSSSLPSPQVI